VSAAWQRGSTGKGAAGDPNPLIIRSRWLVANMHVAGKNLFGAELGE
jgi:hypothetical protein